MCVRKWSLEGLRQECVENAGQKMDSRGSKTRMRTECGSENGLQRVQDKNVYRMLVRKWTLEGVRKECVKNVGQKMDPKDSKRRMR